jgi:hypothetical protein
MVGLPGDARLGHDDAWPHPFAWAAG